MIGLKDKSRWVKVGKDVGGVCFDSFTVGKLKLIKDIGSIILVGSNGNEGFLVEDKKILKSLENKKMHSQLVAKLVFGSTEKWVSFSFTSSPFVDFNGVLKENKKLYKAVYLRNGFQYINTNQVLISNFDSNSANLNCFVIEGTNMSNNISENVRDSILRDLEFYQDEEALFLKEYNDNGVLWLPDGQPLFFREQLESLLPITHHINEFSEHLQFHTIIKDLTCRFCIEVFNFSVSPTGNILCNYFGII